MYVFVLFQVKTLTQFRTSTKDVTDNDEADQHTNNRSRTASCSSTVSHSLNNSMVAPTTTSAVTVGVTSSVPFTTTNTSTEVGTSGKVGVNAIAGPTRETSAPLSPQDLQHRLCMDTEVEELLRKQQRDKGEYLRRVGAILYVFCMYLCMRLYVACSFVLFSMCKDCCEKAT